MPRAPNMSHRVLTLGLMPRNVVDLARGVELGVMAGTRDDHQLRTAGAGCYFDRLVQRNGYAVRTRSERAGFSARQPGAKVPGSRETPQGYARPA